jgi:hypothetical protein
LPVGFFKAQLEPLGDAAMLLAVSDTYGYHVLDFVHALQSGAGLSAAQLAASDSCLSGIYFRSLQNEPGQLLTSSDIESVNKAMTALAAPGTAAAANAISAQDLTDAFNKGIFALGDERHCLP